MSPMLPVLEVLHFPETAFLEIPLEEAGRFKLLRAFPHFGTGQGGDEVRYFIGSFGMTQ